ncbi:MAG: TolC family protein [Candidatus Zixiibacteriota bacterium]|nr:MAG: TolC family protein [candidate division Zixibacteria bacterium]
MIRVISTGLFITLLAANLCWGQAGASAPRVLTLDECMKLAEKHNATLIAARESYNVAKSDVWLGWGKLLPGVNSRLAYSHSETWSPGGGYYNPITESIDSVPPGGIANKYYSASLSAGQSWSLGGYNFYEIREKNASRNSAKSSYELTRQELILAVKQAYFDVLKAKMLLAIQEKALSRASEQLKIAEARYELGAASYSDVLKAKVQYGDVKLALIGAENTLKLAKASLNSWMGQDVDSEIDVEENLIVPEFVYSYDHALQEAMRDNPNMTAAKFDLKSAEAQFGMARSGLFPNFGVSGSYSWNHEDLDEIKNIRKRNYNWALSAYVSFDIFENFTKKHNISYAKANLNSQRENFHQTKRDVALELKQAFLNVEEAQEKIELTKEKVESAQEDLDLMQEKYNLGAANILELLDAEVSFKQAESDQVEALYDYNLAVAQFEKAIGK